MGFHVYTDGFWRKHGVTTEATIVEAKRGRQGGDSWMHMYWWELVADVSDSETGQIVRAEGTVGTAEVFQPGQRVKVRWSAKRKSFNLYNRSTVSEDEWEADAFGRGAGASPVAGATALSGAELSPDQAARVQQALGSLGISGASGVQVVRTQGAGAGGGQPDPIEQLEKLAELRKSGALTDEEFAQQKRRVLGEQ
jgi:hypothetical protein